jgi:hypothetical protein
MVQIRYCLPVVGLSICELPVTGSLGLGRPNWLWKFFRFLDPRDSRFSSRHICIQEDFTGAENKATNLG